MKSMELICMMKEIQKAMSVFECQLTSVHSICLNEAMVLCSLCDDKLSAREISDKTGLTSSHTSKIIKLIEEKKLIKRVLGEKDKRQMYFSLSKLGKEKLELIELLDLEVPTILEPILTKCTTKK